MKIRTMIFAALAFFSANAFAVHCEVNISLSGGGGGTASYDSAVGCTAPLASVANLVISITVGGTTWTQSQLTSKHGTLPYGNLNFEGAACGQAWWDDPDNGSGDTAIAVFTNGGQVLAFEALVRWMHPVRGMVPPNDFIPIAESTGLIGPLTQWVVDSALAQLAEWSVTHPGLSVAVNISARNLRDDLPGWILNRLVAHRVKASQLVLEITETSFATDPVRATALLEELSAAGVRVSLDDFGQVWLALDELAELLALGISLGLGVVEVLSLIHISEPTRPY